MKDDTPTAKSTPAEPTPAATTAMPEVNINSANATAIAIGRPTPSPDQLLLHPTTTASSATSSDSTSPIANDHGVQIGGGNGGNATDSTPTSLSSPDNTILRQEPSSYSSSLEKSDSTSPAANDNDNVNVNVAIGVKSTNDTPNGKQRSGNAKAVSSAEEDDYGRDAFITTPSPFKRQSSASSLANNNEEAVMHDSNDAAGNNNTTAGLTPPDCRLSMPSDDANGGTFGPLPMLPSSALRQGFPMPPARGVGTGVVGNGIFSRSLMETPNGPGSLFRNFSNVNDFDLLGQEVLAAASTATAMLSRYDGFEAGMLLPSTDTTETTTTLPDGLYPGGASAMASTMMADAAVPTATTAMTTPGGGLDAMPLPPPLPNVQPEQQPQGGGGGMDTFELPPYVQAHFDETFTASTYDFPRPNPINEQRNAFRHGGGMNIFHRPVYAPVRIGSGLTTFNAESTQPAAAAVDVAAASRSYTTSTEFDSTTMPPPVGEFMSNAMTMGSTVGRGKTLGQLAKLPAQPTGVKTRAANATKKPGAKARPLPLRKRKLQVDYNDEGSDDDDVYKPLSAIAAVAAPLVAAAGPHMRPVRHNERKLEEGERVTCRCSKSKCLKLYCDCFQRGKICIDECECKNCQNTKENSGPNGIRTNAIRAVIERRGMEAFQPRSKDTEDGCRCKKNKCLKKYCICFGAGMKCDHRCRCKDCGNKEESNGTARKSAVHPVVEVVVPKASMVVPKALPEKYSFFSAAEAPKLPHQYTFGFAVEGDLENEEQPPEQQQQAV